MKIVSCIIFMVSFCASLHAQIPISTQGVVNTCNAVFTDDGIGGAYTDTPYTITICPDNPDDVIQANFAAFSLQESPGNGNSDLLFVYDGMDNTAMSLGPYSGSIANLQITATVNNPTGCLTFVFDPNGPANTTFPGWEAIIECTTPCANPTLASAIIDPTPVAADQTVAVCVGETVSFSGAGSAPQPGFTIDQYTWDFADGTSGTGSNVSHAFTAPGEYVVNLTVTDNNGCNNLNVIPLQVLVSTSPTFTGMNDLTTCLGDTVFGVVVIGENSLVDDFTNIGGSANGTTWTALPPQVVVGETYLADGAGFSFASEIVYDFFEPGQTLDNCDDFWGVMVNMEHSYSGDVSISITCPNGTIVDLVAFPSGGGGTYLGEPIDDGFGTSPTEPGVGYDYEWVTDSPNGTWNEAFQGGVNGGSVIAGVGTPIGNTLAPGQYSSVGNLCDLVGCPLNGAWTFAILDNLGADNGYIFEWGLNLNPALYPDVTTFTPTIGAGPDSSYWVTSGNDSGIQWINSISNDGDLVEIIPGATGAFDFTYYVVNSFGCEFDTTIQVTVTEAPSVTAGPDQLISCGTVQLDGGLENDPVVDCASCGVYTYCYDVFDFYQQTYCPDNAGDGFVSITFLEGSAAVNDNLFVFDGPDTWPSPQIGMYNGDLTGLSWTSTDPSGCLTFYISEWDGVGNCTDGGAEEFLYTVTAGSAEAASFIWNWTPNNPLDFSNISDPTVLDLNQTTTFTLTGHPLGYPGCSSSDQVVVGVDPLGDPGTDADLEICPTAAPFSLFPELGGNPAGGGIWYYNPGGGLPLVAQTDDIFDPLNDVPGDYDYVISVNADCQNFATVTIEMPLPTEITTPDDTTICNGGQVNLSLYALSEGLAPFQYDWTFNGSSLSSSANTSLDLQENGEACLSVTDACNYTVSNCFDIEVLPVITPSFTSDTTAGCWPYGFQLSVENDPAEFAQSRWVLTDGSQFINQNDLSVAFEYPGSYGVELILTNAAGCSYSVNADNYLNSYAPPEANYSFGPQPTDIFNTEIQFNDESTGFPISSYLWTFSTLAGELLGGSAAANPVFNFPDNYGGTYLVNLQVTDINGCTDVVPTGNVVIDDLLQFYIPTGFTPNNDGLNDVLKLEGADIDPDRFSFQIFNRFGELVFEAQNPSDVWTGEVRDGEYFAQNGAYSWIAIIVSKSTGVKRELSGSVLVVR
jgi:gliding motility-associated-like protein